MTTFEPYINNSKSKPFENRKFFQSDFDKTNSGNNNKLSGIGSSIKKNILNLDLVTETKEDDEDIISISKD